MGNGRKIENLRCYWFNYFFLHFPQFYFLYSAAHCNPFLFICLAAKKASKSENYKTKNSQIPRKCCKKTHLPSNIQPYIYSHLHIYIYICIYTVDCVFVWMCVWGERRRKWRNRKRQCGKCRYEFGCQKLSGTTKLVNKSKRWPTSQWNAVAWK